MNHTQIPQWDSSHFFYKYMDAPADYFKELDRMRFVEDHFKKNPKASSIMLWDF